MSGTLSSNGRETFLSRAHNERLRSWLSSGSFAVFALLVEYFTGSSVRFELLASLFEVKNRLLCPSITRTTFGIVLFFCLFGDRKDNLNELSKTRVQKTEIDKNHKFKYNAQTDELTFSLYVFFLSLYNIIYDNFIKIFLTGNYISSFNSSKFEYILLIFFFSMYLDLVQLSRYHFFEKKGKSIKYLLIIWLNSTIGTHLFYLSKF
ncbi:hypothetical protein BpHYR1_047361 [Brachionus plicatilis]|uniref:Uncharacterized protein n=1 Tax=Brachionus plicatilis TaxID=10195 RepID=A0A3M7RTX3_BRAPC|nr:hypothetical protein BpHYR1_047361 [Brachionus plicatilis]